MELKLPTGTLDRIQECNSEKPDKDIVSFEHVVYIWKQQGQLFKVQRFRPFTWQSIIEALRTVGEIALAKTLTSKHLHSSMFAIYCAQVYRLKLSALDLLTSYTCS